jgi:hypothetical protein
MLRFVARVLIARQHDLRRTDIEAATIRTPVYRAKVDYRSPLHAGVMVSVADTGTGIGSQELERKFNPLFTTKLGGMGTVGHVFAGVDSIALEYRFANGLHGIEFMTLNADGLASLAVGNDVVRCPT